MFKRERNPTTGSVQKRFKRDINERAEGAKRAETKKGSDRAEGAKRAETKKGSDPAEGVERAETKKGSDPKEGDYSREKYRDYIRAVEDMMSKQSVVLVGYAGCGKSTLAGLYREWLSQRSVLNAAIIATSDEVIFTDKAVLFGYDASRGTLERVLDHRAKYPHQQFVITCYKCDPGLPLSDVRVHRFETFLPFTEIDDFMKCMKNVMAL